MTLRTANETGGQASHLILREALLREVRQAGVRRGRSLPSIRDISRRHGVSKAVAERAVRSLIDDGICYAEQGRGVFLAVGSREELGELLRASRTVAVVFGFMEYPRTGHLFYRQVYEGTQEWIAAERYNVLKLYNWRSKATAHKDRELARFTGGVDGFIALGIYSDEDCVRLRNTGVPLVVLDYDTESLGVDCVVMDNAATMYRLAGRVMAEDPGELFLLCVERLSGDDPAHVERRASVERAAAERERELRPEGVIALHVDEEGGDRERLGGIREALRKGGRRPAVVLDDEHLVERAVRTLAAWGFEPGRDYLLAYVGPAEPLPEVGAHPALVGAYDYRKLGGAGGELLGKRMESGAGRPVKVTVTGEVRERAPVRAK